VTESSGVMVKQTFMEILLETSRAHRGDFVNLIGKCEEWSHIVRGFVLDS